MKIPHVPAKIRDYVYTVGTAAIAVLIFYGVLADTAAAVWVGLLGAILQVGEGTLAARYRPGKKGINGSHTGDGPTERGL